MIRLAKPIKEVDHVTVGYHWMYHYGLHKGIDFRTRCEKYPTGIGTPIRACASGKWGDMGYMKYGYGNYVIIDHENGYQTLYAHLTKNAFKPGYVNVNRGDIIGNAGNTGRSIGPHLHFELRKDGKKINPNLGFKEAEKLLEWARARAIMQVDNKGAITFKTKDNRFIELTPQNAWDVVSQNIWGINESDYQDLIELSYGTSNKS
jgi:murein DD-endopeptidase MepM/ murein hydrolase activator NlpD|tara:strand:- start:42 stop:656 length:615 start_codon:yes stop_codon:yes gene_type:complete